ncbi:M14 family metallopeptidase [Acidobacteriota bacterium]
MSIQRHKKKIWLKTIVFFTVLSLGALVSAEELKFEFNHTFGEVVDYLNGLTKTYPNITKIHNIGKSFLGNDLLVLEITNKDTGKGLDKPGYWIDGNLHASEVMGAEVCLKTIDTLVTQYGKDPFITGLVDTRTIYIMPKLNPDGSDHYLTKPDSMRSSVRPHDSDRDGVLDDDPGEDLNGDFHLTQMRKKDENGQWKTSPDDPRLMVRRGEGEKGEWTTYSEGIDNDKDGRFNEDGVGGLDINRNWPSRWQQESIQNGAGFYPLSEPETRAVAEFLMSHRNVTGVVNHHMSGNFLYRPPTNKNYDPITGEEISFPQEDDSNFETFGQKYTEIINDQRVQKVLGRGAPPREGAIFGVMIGWAYDHYGVFSWVPEMGSLVPFCDYDGDGRVSDMEQLKWNDTEMGGKVFVDWKPFTHPQLGEVEIGGFVRKTYDPIRKAYTNVLCAPGEKFEDFLKKHTEWNLYLVSQSPLVQIVDISLVSGDAGYFKIKAGIQNQGFLPTNVTRHAIDNRTAKTVKVFLTLNEASLEMGEAVSDIGHLSGPSSRSDAPIETVEWMVKASKTGSPSAAIKVVSEKGGTVEKKIALK